MLIDEIEVEISGGHGGVGKVSFGPGKYSGPDGGNGGQGGDVHIRATSDIYGLNQFSKSQALKAEDGQMGQGNRKFGKDGADLEINLPVGSELADQESGEVIELQEINQRILICKGGLGGRGNYEFRSPRNTTPEYAQKGLPGQKRSFKINLKLIADFGLIGLPNAGKSSLLNELTAARAKTADYPFTTLEPNLGVLPLRHPERSEGSIIIADIPGLIEGASTGKGLGIKFLKHIERVKLLLHCIDATSENPVKDYKTIKKEMEQYSKDLANKEEITLITKSDLVDKKELDKKVKTLKKLNRNAIPVSIHDFDAIEKFKRTLFDKLT